MNNKFLPGAVLIIIAFVLSNLASPVQVKAQNTFYGEGAGHSMTTGTFDAAFGYSALYYTTSGNQNTAIGASALIGNTIGDYNTATGAFALPLNTTGSSNTATANRTIIGLRNTRGL